MGSLHYFMQQHIIPQLLSTATEDSHNDDSNGALLQNSLIVDCHLPSLDRDGLMKSFPIHIISDNAKSPSSQSCRSSSLTSGCDRDDTIVPQLCKHEKPVLRLRSANNSNSNSARKSRIQATIVSKSTVRNSQGKQSKSHVLESSSKTAQQHIEECLRRKLVQQSFQRAEVSQSLKTSDQVTDKTSDVNDVSPMRTRVDSDSVNGDNGRDDDLYDECFSRHHDSLSLLSGAVSPCVGQRTRTKPNTNRPMELPSTWFESTSIRTLTEPCNDNISMSLYGGSSPSLQSWIEESDDEEVVDTQPVLPKRKNSVNYAISNESPSTPVNNVTTMMKVTSRFQNVNNLSTLSSPSQQQRGRTKASPFYDISSPLSVKKPVRQRSWDESLCTESSESDDDDDDVDFAVFKRMNKKVVDIKSCVDSVITSKPLDNSRCYGNRITKGVKMDLHQVMKDAADISSMFAASKRSRSRTISSQHEDNRTSNSRIRSKMSSSSSSSSLSSQGSQNKSKSYSIQSNDSNGSDIPTVALIDTILASTSIFDHESDM